jgi:hypothetical protein
MRLLPCLPRSERHSGRGFFRCPEFKARVLLNLFLGIASSFQCYLSLSLQGSDVGIQKDHHQ